MKKRVSLLALVMVLLLVSVAAAAGTPTQYVTYAITFWNADDTYEFAVEKAQGAGDLTVDTADCCIAGDLWRVDLAPSQPANPANKVTGIGSGEINVWSGKATAHPWVRGKVVVSYESGVDAFPAGMCVRFQYTKAPGVIVEPPEGVSEGCWWMDAPGSIMRTEQAGANR